MASSKEMKDFVLEQLRNLNNISIRPMMGEFILYYNAVIFGGIYDDRLLIKKTESNKEYNLTEIIPYKNAKPMYMIDNLEDEEYLKEIITKTYLDLKNKT